MLLVSLPTMIIGSWLLTSASTSSLTKASEENGVALFAVDSQGLLIYDTDLGSTTPDDAAMLKAGVLRAWARQVMLAPPVMQLVTAPSLVLGLFNLRIVPLIDTAALLGVGSIDVGAFAVVLHTSSSPAGLATTAVPTRVSLEVPATASELPGTTGTYFVDGRVVVLLDPSALLVTERLDGPDAHSGQVAVGIPVLILSSRSNQTDRQRGLDAGADGYIVKSGFDEGSLLTAVNRLVGARS
jgi:chemotaxis signal transduction protein